MAQLGWEGVCKAAKFVDGPDAKTPISTLMEHWMTYMKELANGTVGGHDRGRGQGGLAKPHIQILIDVGKVRNAESLGS